MIIVVNEKTYNMSLISNIKEQVGPKKLKNIIKSLRNFSKEDLKELSNLEIKVIEGEKQEEKKPDFKTFTSIIGFQHYCEDFKKSNSISIVNNKILFEGENTPSTVDDNEEELKQIDNSGFSADK